MDTLDTLYTCTARPGGDRATSIARLWKTRAREYLNRGELSGRVKQCRVDMQLTLDLFNVSELLRSRGVRSPNLWFFLTQTRLQIDQAFTLHAMAAVLEEIRSQQTVCFPVHHSDVC